MSEFDQDDLDAVAESLTRDEPIASLEEIAVRRAARPIVDPRSINDIIVYDDFGLPR